MIAHYQRYILIFFCLVMLIGSAGCFDESAGQITMPEPVAQTDETVREQSNIDVYWDATVSMRGYTTLAAGNVYRTLPDLLGDIGGAMGEIKFYSFGEKVHELDGREHRKFSTPEVYTEKITAVHNVIDTANADHLSIIITDLFESDSDWSNVTKKLREKYFSKHKAVAIIGIKNSFMGDIFDVGLNAATYYYNSYDYDYKFRPFYLFVMGSENEVMEFMERWKDKQTAPNEMNYVLFSETLTSPAVNFSNLSLGEMQNFFIDENLDINDKRMKEFGIDTFDEPAVLNVSFSYQPVFGACPLDINALNTKVQVFTLEEENQWQLNEAENDASLELKEDEKQPSLYHVKLTFTPSRTLKPDKINFVNASLVPSAKSYKLPDWINRWNMANVDVAPEQFDGSKTINLIHVMESLKDSVLISARPALINMNLVIKR